MSIVFSTIMAVYNTGDYLAEAIESVLSQDFPHDMSELILVNDGSTDNSGIICQKYASEYPEKIVYIEQDNQGVSAARNNGINIARGKYLNFLDSDDILDNNAFQKVYDFYQEYGDKTDIVSIPIKFFGSADGDHILNYKFWRTRLIDLDIEFTSIQLSSSSAFFRKNAIGELRFDQNVKYGEDVLFVNQILIKKHTLGVISDTTYWYRRRNTSTSALQKAATDPDYYLPCLNNISLKLIRICMAEGLSCPRFLQYMLAYDLKWRIGKATPPTCLSDPKDADRIEETAREILSHIDVDIILRHQHLSLKQKEYYLSLKTGKPLHQQFIYVKDKNRNDVYAVFHEYIIAWLSRRAIYIHSIRIQDNVASIAGAWATEFDQEHLSIWADIKKCDASEPTLSLKAELKPYTVKDNYMWGQLQSHPACFEVPSFLLNGSIKVSFRVCFGDICSSVPLHSGLYYSSLNTEDSYFLMDGYYVKLENNSLLFQKAEADLVSAQEKQFIDSLRSHAMLSEEELEGIQQLRKTALDHYYSSHNKIWLFTDRIDLADDNAECLFDYCMAHKEDFPGIDMYFVLSGSSKHYARVSEKGNIVDYDSEECKELYLKADAIISSQANLTTFSVYGDHYKYYKGLQVAKKIFLQHGIIKDDMSEWLHDWNKHLDLFVTASPYEYESILNGGYGYTDRVVKLTGFPRHDRLNNKAEKIILFMPTWDSALSKYDTEGQQVYSEAFKDTELYAEIQDLLSDSELKLLLNEYDYQLVVKLHPNLWIQREDFQINGPITLASPEISYQELFSKGALLITDYSSVQFDFAYLRKPVLYYQCRANHLKSGYYDYNEMGFGEVVSSVSTLTNHIREYLSTNCEMKEQYKKRADSFFAFSDKENCKRVMTEIRSLLQ